MKSVFLLFYFLLPDISLAAGDHGPDLHLDGSSLGLLWTFPFVGILLSIAILPLVSPDFWHHNFGKISMFWGSLFLIPFLIYYGPSLTLYEVLHVALLEYIPFIILLFALYTISGGVRLTGSLVGKPIVNVIILLIGTLLSSWMGTTGSAMLLIRPLINANKYRKNIVHIVIFFIFLVANIGGSLTPLGDPPLFLGFLKGVDFFWTTKFMFLPMLFMVISLLIIFFILDTIMYKRESNLKIDDNGPLKLGIEGSFNLYLILGVIAAVLMSGFWKPHFALEIYHVPVQFQNILRDLILLSLAYLSWSFTTQKIRINNEFTWFPIVEVAKLFAGIFITIIPAIAILKAGPEGVLSFIIDAVSSKDINNPEIVIQNNFMYFWLTGILSSFLDNAPTYLVFFNTAGGEAAVTSLMENGKTLLAISMGAVFMGANTYIGNAPNFMVKSISESSGVKMPSFFGYFFKWAIPILAPLFLIVSWIFCL